MTTTSSIILHLHEVRAALRGELGLIVRPATGLGGTRKEDWLSKCPFAAPGTRLRCKETWGRNMDEFHYKASADDLDTKWIRWHSPATMPAWASRITLEVVNVEVRGLDDLTAQDARKTGFQRDDDVMVLGALLAEWQTRYQPKGMGIESKPWIWKCEVRSVE